MPSRPPFTQAAVAIILSALLAARATSAAAAGPGEAAAPSMRGGGASPIVWWSLHVDCIEATPAFIEELHRELALACDAIGGGCAVVPVGEDRIGARRAAVLCAPSSWSLVIEDPARGAGWSVAIDSAADDRARVIAMWLARDEARAERPAVDGTTRARTGGAAIPGGDSRGGVAIALRAATRGSLAPVALGGEASFTLRPSREVYAALVVGGERALSSDTSYSLALARGGARIGWGAPWGTRRFGVAAEAGVLLGTVGAPADVSPSSRGFARPYAQLGVLAQMTSSPVRPWVGLFVLAQDHAVVVSESAQAVGRLPVLAAALDVGVAWHAF